MYSTWGFRSKLHFLHFFTPKLKIQSKIQNFLVKEKWWTSSFNLLRHLKNIVDIEVLFVIWLPYQFIFTRFFYEPNFDHVINAKSREILMFCFEFDSFSRVFSKTQISDNSKILLFKLVSKHFTSFHQRQKFQN